MLDKYKDSKWLEDQYVNQEKSIEDIATLCKVDKQKIIDALNDFRIYKHYKRNNWLNQIGRAHV